MTQWNTGKEKHCSGERDHDIVVYWESTKKRSTTAVLKDQETLGHLERRKAQQRLVVKCRLETALRASLYNTEKKSAIEVTHGCNEENTKRL